MLSIAVITCIWAAAFLRETGSSYLKHEPDYYHLVYGNVWRHIIFAPEPNSDDVVTATKHLHDMLKSIHPDLVGSLANIKCLNQYVLWYSHTEWSPYLMESVVSSSGGDKYPISVPVPIGSTFNFLMSVKLDNKSSIQHTFTITKSSHFETFYLYSYTNQNVRDDEKCVSEGHVWNSCKNIASDLPVLSSLAQKSHYKSLDSYRNKARQADGMSLPKAGDQQHAALSNSLVNSSKLQSCREGLHHNNMTVMTYNIWNFNSYSHKVKYSQRMQRISKMLGGAKPDILGLQEVRFEYPSGGKLGPNQVQHLASALPGYQYVFQPAQLFRESFHQGRTEEGVAIFSKYPIVHRDYLLLFRNRSNSADSHQRLCLHAVIDYPGIGAVHVYNTHLSLSHEAREASVLQILQFIAETSEGEPAFFMGDLNATPEEKAVRMLSDGSGLADVWDIIHPDFSGFTFNSLEDELSKKIDYIFMKRLKHVVAKEIKVLPDLSKSNAASDHRAVIATFHVKQEACHQSL